MDVSLTATSIHFGYNGSAILKDVSLLAAAGQVTILAGPNGSGKTTLLKCLAGLLRMASGDVGVEGTSLASLSVRKRARRIAYMPQRIQTTFSSTVFDVVLTGRRPYIAWRPSNADFAVVRNAIEKVGVGSLAHRSITELSGGEAQKVFIARGIAQDTPTMMFDEPTSSLDIRHQFEVMELFRRLAREERKTVIVTLHDLNLAAKYADRLFLMRAGRIVASGAPGEVLNEKTIKDVYQVEGSLHERESNPHVVCELGAREQNNKGGNRR